MLAVPSAPAPAARLPPSCAAASRVPANLLSTGRMVKHLETTARILLPKLAYQVVVMRRLSAHGAVAGVLCDSDLEGRNWVWLETEWQGRETSDGSLPFTVD